MASMYLRYRHIEPPKFALFDRIGHFDQDNWSILGAVVGLFIAGRRSRLILGLSQPVWYAVHGIAGISLANSCYAAREIYSSGLSNYMDNETKFQTNLQKMSYQSEVLRELVVSGLNAQEAFREARKGSITLSPETLVALRDRITPVSDQMACRALNLRKDVSEVLYAPPNQSNGPHKTVALSGDVEPVPYASKNYDWTPDQPGAVVQLEDHIRKLQLFRQQACDEAEEMWRWLYDRELEYYQRKAKAQTNGNSNGLKKMKKYIEILGKRQSLAYQTVAKWDWMIADAQRQLDLAKAVNQTGSLHEASKSTKESGAPGVKLTQTLKYLDVHIVRTKSLLQTLQAELLQTRKRANDPATGYSFEQPLEAKAKHLEEMIRCIEEDRKASSRVYEEALERSEPSDSGSE